MGGIFSNYKLKFTQCDQSDYLKDRAPSMAHALKAVGYITAHFGKWHMGGGSDLGDVPYPTEYGFDKSLWEKPWLMFLQLCGNMPATWEGQFCLEKNSISPNLAIRDGNWKLLINADSTKAQLYNLKDDPIECNNLINKNISLAESLANKVISRGKSMPVEIPELIPSFEYE